jgi:hypothetical protein
MLLASIYVAFRETFLRELLSIGKLNLLSIVTLIACLISARLVGPLGKKFLLGLVLLTFFVSQGRSVLGTYRHSGLYQHRKIMTLSDLQIVENVYASRWFSGRDVLPLLVADYMPRTTVFLYDQNLYPKELLGWSGRNPDTTFVFGEYQATVDDSFKLACLSRPHVIYKGRASLAKVPLYIATPLSIYEKEREVFLMKDAMMDYLIPGSWRTSQHD